jgi:hypothetical protein
VPVGTEVDARQGTVRLVAASATRHQTYTGDFQSAIFQILQSRSGRERGLTTLRLLEAAFEGAPGYAQCATIGKARLSGGAASAARRRLSNHVLQLLRATVHGHFRTRGSYGAATARGTEYSVADRCDGTLTGVMRGTVVVTDFRLRRNIALTAGKSYLAKA